MAPPSPRKSLPKDHFAAAFSTLKTQTYHDPSTRGPGSHTIRSIAWNPTGHLIATGSVDRTLRIWNPEKPQVKNSTELRGHAGAIERVAWNPVQEAELASVSSDGTCRFWDIRSKTCIQTIQLGGEGLTISWSVDGRAVMVGRKDDTLIPISLPSYTSLPPIPQPSQTNQTLFPPTPPPPLSSHSSLSSPSPLFSSSPTPPPPPSSILLTTGTGTIKIATYPSLHPLHTLHSHTSSCFCLELSPTGQYLATGGSDALICLWDTTDWVCKRTLGHMVGSVRGLSFSWDGGYVVGGSDEGNGLDVAHVETGEYVWRVETGAPAPCVAWHPSRYWLAYSGDPLGLKIVGAAGGGL